MLLRFAQPIAEQSDSKRAGRDAPLRSDMDAGSQQIQVFHFALWTSHVQLASDFNRLRTMAAASFAGSLQHGHWLNVPAESA